ncbi:MAG: YicC family protein [Saprospiraceae bacterium]|nr:YicC family protein [Saprospiraceae bacterium]
MIKSMTGFGKSEVEFPNKKITIEIKSLNSKQFDISTRMPFSYNEKDLDIRNIISKKLERGKVFFSLNSENKSNESVYSINKDIAKKYYSELKSLAEEIGEDKTTDYMQLLSKMPEVIAQEKDKIDDTEWQEILKCVDESIVKLNEFRSQEGESIEKDFVLRISIISELLENVDKFEEERIIKIKEKFRKSLNGFIEENKIDENRFEQEVIYYLEKIDITEEKIRMAKHLEYFIQTMNESSSQGKKLAFIAQEIGREINTLGSKANDVDMQKIVVQMKDELEKIKEQLMNVL